MLIYTYDISEYENSDNRQLDTYIYLYDFSNNTANILSTDKQPGTIDLDPRFSPNEAEVIFVNTSNDGISVKSIYSLKIYDTEERERKFLFYDATMPDWE